jgi:enoyl-CoA hydratase
MDIRHKEQPDMPAYQHIQYAPMDYKHVSYEVADKIAHVKLNRPNSRNVQSTIMLEELDHAIAKAGGDRNVHVIVLSGEGKSFSAGHDLGSPEELAHLEKFPIEEGARGIYERSWRLYVDMHLRWRNVPKPMICAVQGHCIFGGWMVASTADIIFAADDALFLGSLFQYFSIPYDLHPRRAKELLFQGRFIGAPEAKELGLVNRVIPRERLLEETMQYARDVAQNDPFDMRTTKLAVNQALDAQGFSAFIESAHSTHIARRISWADPGFALPKPQDSGVKRLPMVQVALERYEREQKRLREDAQKN